VVDEVGELVITKPMPSMPLYFWADPKGTRYRESDFETFAGVWRHGDWIRFTPRGSSVIYGRSDSTINRFGIRMGTAEIYRVVEELPEIRDSLVVDLEFLGWPSFMPLFVVLKPGCVLDAALKTCIANEIRTRASARYPTRWLRSTRFRAHSPARRWRCRCASCCWACRARRWRAPTRWTTRRAWRSSSAWRNS
jgi:acetoacetyl-CoA synthetase